MEKNGQLRIIEDIPESQANTDLPVECFGKTFPNENARREYYTALLAMKLKDVEFRKTEGFPIGSDETILAMSDPPYYTACPNPFLEEWLVEHAKPYCSETDEYHREPFAADVSEGKSDPIYIAHSYHTKVPHKAIMRYLLHYTEPGDVVYDGFCGTGMTGVAAQMCSDKRRIGSLGLTVDSEQRIFNTNAENIGSLGARKIILNDLSPIATFISANYNLTFSSVEFSQEATQLLLEIENEYGWMYGCLHNASSEETQRIADALGLCDSSAEVKQLYDDISHKYSSLLDKNSRLFIGSINCMVWSDVLICPECGEEIVLWNVGLDHIDGKVSDQFRCTSCNTEVTKKQCDNATITVYDDGTNQAVRHTKQNPALIVYTVEGKRYTKVPDNYDLALITYIENCLCDYPYPIIRMPDGDESRRNDVNGITHIHQFYSRRNLIILAALQNRATKSPQARALLFQFDSLVVRQSKLTRFLASYYFHGGGGWVGTPLSGTLYIPSFSVEVQPFETWANRIKKTIELDFPKHMADVLISTGDAASTTIGHNVVDYIFTDPPFGGNLMYSELNFIWESWLGIITNNKAEVITNRTQRKHLYEYQGLMTQCFANYYHILKPGRWMTVEFHNSANAVWNSIQEALEHVGFIVADVRVLDKRQGSFKQVNSAAAVKQDLVISCYKPRDDFEQRFNHVKGQPEGIIEFVRQHLLMLPVASVTLSGKLESVSERMNFLLFDRMVAYHLKRSARIPMSASEFYKMLEWEFVERDGMYFLPDQAARYDAVRVRTDVEPLSLFVKDERTALQWVRSELHRMPQTLGYLTPRFMQEIQALDNYEAVPELRDLMKENFILMDDGNWRVPDSDSEKDIESMRSKTLLRVFQSYMKSTGQLKKFRKEAILEGFRHCWQTKQYGVIVSVCEKIPAKILQDIQEFVQFYDISKDLAPEPQPQLEFTWEA